MGRKSLLTDKQWATVERRMLDGENVRALAREFSISEAAIRKRLGTTTKQIKEVATNLARAELEFKALPLTAQISARTLADDLKEISSHLAASARYSAATAHRLSGIANAKVLEIDDAAPMTDDSRKALTDVAALTKMANEASHIPLNLLAANKETVKRIVDEPPPTVSDLSDEELNAELRELGIESP